MILNKKNVMDYNYPTSNLSVLSVDSGHSFEGESNMESNFHTNLNENFASECENKQMMSEYQLESNLGTDLDSNLNSNFDDYGLDDVDNGTENLNSNMSGSYMSNDSIRRYQKKKLEGFDSENIRY